MSKTLLARLAKLEASKGKGGRVVPVFTGGGDKADVEARKAEMIRNGEASEQDTFIVFKTIYEERPNEWRWGYQ